MKLLEVKLCKEKETREPQRPHQSLSLTNLHFICGGGVVCWKSASSAV